MKNCKPHEKLSLKVSVSNRFTNEIGSFHDYAIYIIFNVFLCAMDKLGKKNAVMCPAVP